MIVAVRSDGRGIVVLTRQVPTSTGMLQLKKLQLSNFLWIIGSLGDAGRRLKLATFWFLWIMDFPLFGFPFKFGFRLG